MHIHHLEHMPFFLSKTEMSMMLIDLISTVYSETIDPNKLTVKMDGAPAIVFGILPSGQSFISTKSFFNKTPKYYVSEIEIDAIPDKLLAEKLKFYKNKLDTAIGPRLSKNGTKITYDMYDVIKDPFSLTDKGAKPNVIEYRFSEYRQDMDFIIYAHSPKVNYLSSYVIMPFEGHFSKGYTKVFESIPSLLSLCMTENDIESGMSKQEINYLIKQENDFIRAGLEVGFPFDVQDYIYQLKRILLDELNTRVNIDILPIPYYNDKLTQHEGFVFNWRGYSVKLIDRMVFSKRNFEGNKPWKTANQ